MQPIQRGPTASDVIMLRQVPLRTQTGPVKHLWTCGVPHTIKKFLQQCSGLVKFNSKH